MRLRQLELISFGHFENRVLDFGDKAGVVKLVYGENEAGKSTSLRAVETLLFGFEHRPRDAHSQESSGLRVGGTLLCQNGNELRVLRKNKRKQSLRRADDESPILPETWNGLLGGIDKDLFRALYGLDPVRLREGAKALLDAQGGLGESLFEAGLAGAGASRLAKTLRAEAEAIWSPRATAKPLAEALRGLSEAKLATQREATLRQAYHAQEQGIRDAEERRRLAELELAELEKRRRHQDRGIRLAPRLRDRRTLVAERTAIGTVVLLPEGAREEREAAERAEREARVALETSRATLAEVEQALATLGPARAQLEWGSQIADLAELIGGAQQFAKRAPKQSLEREQLLTSLARSKSGALLEEAEEQGLRTGLQEKSLLQSNLIRALAERQAEEAPDSESESEGDPRQASAEPCVTDAALEAAERRLSREQERDAEREEIATQIAELTARAESLRRSLGLGADTPTGAPEQLPSDESCARLANEAATLAEERRRLTRELSRNKKRSNELSRERSVQAGGEELSEAKLSERRRERDARVLDGAPPSELLALIRETDELSDRLRHEATRLAHLSRLDAELADLAVERREQESEFAEIDSALAKCDQRAATASVALSGPALTASELGSWVQRHRQWLAEHARRQTLIDKQSDRDTRLGRAREEAERVLGAGAASDTAHLLAALRAETSERAANAKRAEQVAHERQRVRLKQQQLSQQVAELEALLARKNGELYPMLQTLGLSVDSPEPSVLRALSDNATARAQRARLDQLEREVREAQLVRQELQHACERLAVWWKEIAVPEDPLVHAERLMLAMRAEEQAEQLRRREQSRREATLLRMAEAEQRKVAANTQLEGLASRAGVARAQLPMAEQESQRAREIDQKLAALDATVHALGDGAPIAEIEAEYLELSVDQAESELEELEEQKALTARARDAATQEAVGLRLGLVRYSSSRAAEHAELAQQQLAAAEPLLERYAVLRLSAAVLEREMESYRLQNQGPVLSRASELFRQLTQERYLRLGVELSDRDVPEITCVRANGHEVGVEGLSDGTRDQLFLALRLATVERHADEVEPLFLVLDDVLVHFDDARARAALRVLGQTAARLDVLLFSHHARIVELAREELGDNMVLVTL